MAKTYNVDHMDYKEVAERIRCGQIFIYPTDTVYGIGCDAMNEDAVDRIFTIKGRDGGKPMSVAFSDTAQLLKFVVTDKRQRGEIEAKLPGAYTFIVTNKDIPQIVTAGLPTVGVRVPDYEPIQRLIKEAGTPIVTTSANESGKPPARCIEDVPESIIKMVDFVVEDGKCGSGQPSKVVNLITGENLR